MLAEPTPTLCASPALLIVAVETVSEDQMTVLVISCVLPSVNVPVAVNCRVVPDAMVWLAGVTAMETRAAADTVSDVEAVTVPEVAVMVVVPTPTLVARPSVPVAPLMVAMPVADELHVTVPVRFCVLPSVNVPVAVNC